MNWQTITVFQWQQLTDLFTQSKDVTDLDLLVKSAAIITNQTEHQIDSIPVGELKPLLDKIAFIHTDIQPKAVKVIKVNDKRYKCIYDVRNIPAARYIESKHFSTDVNGNLHKIMACMVMPMRYTWRGWVEDNYDASKHSAYAEDMLSAPISQVLGSVVFFYQVYNLWIKNSRGYLTKEMEMKGITKYQAEAAYQTLCNIMDGYTKPNWLPIMKGSPSRKRSTSKQSTT
jgi:hypothetical protein